MPVEPAGMISSTPFHLTVSPTQKPPEEKPVGEEDDEDDAVPKEVEAPRPPDPPHGLSERSKSDTDPSLLTATIFMLSVSRSGVRSALPAAVEVWRGAEAVTGSACCAASSTPIAEALAREL